MFVNVANVVACAQLNSTNNIATWIGLLWVDYSLLQHTFVHCTISRSSWGWEWEGIGNCQLGKYGNGIKVSDGNGNGMGMGMKTMKWEGIGTKNQFPHISKQYQYQLLVSSYRQSTIGWRAFPIAGARVWNDLPSDVTSAPSMAVFGRHLKTTFSPLLQCCLTVPYSYIVVLEMDFLFRPLLIDWLTPVRLLAYWPSRLKAQSVNWASLSTDAKSYDSLIWFSLRRLSSKAAKEMSCLATDLTLYAELFFFF